MPVWWSLVLLMLPIAAVFVGIVVMSRRTPPTPRGWRRYNAWVAPLVTMTFLLFAVMAGRRGEYSVAALMLVVTLINVATVVFGHVRGVSASEAKQNFAADPGRCGRCDYDLTGNTSGICPECGWEIPRGELDIDSPGWAMWWHKWEIERLQNWRKTLVFLLVMMLAFLLIGVWMVSRSIWLVIALPAVMTISFGINAWRVIQYGRKHR